MCAAVTASKDLEPPDLDGPPCSVCIISFTGTFRWYPLHEITPREAAVDGMRCFHSRDCISWLRKAAYRCRDDANGVASRFRRAVARGCRGAAGSSPALHRKVDGVAHWMMASPHTVVERVERKRGRVVLFDNYWLYPRLRSSKGRPGESESERRRGLFSTRPPPVSIPCQAFSEGRRSLFRDLGTLFLA